MSLGVMTVGAVSSRLMNVPGRRLGCPNECLVRIERPALESRGWQRFDTIEKERQNITMFDSAATDEQYPKPERQQHPN